MPHFTPPKNYQKYWQNCEKREIKGPQNSRILREKTFGRKYASFEHFQQITDSQIINAKTAEKSNGRRKKVNAKLFCGVDFWKFGVLTETRFGAKFEPDIAQNQQVCARFLAKTGGHLRQKAAQKGQ